MNQKKNMIQVLLFTGILLIFMVGLFYFLLNINLRSYQENNSFYIPVNSYSFAGTSITEGISEIQASISIDSMQSSEEIISVYQNVLFRMFPQFLIIFSVIIFLGLFIFWTINRRREEDRYHSMLNRLKRDAIDLNDPIFEEYQLAIQRNTTDTSRLNSYILHDQKNMLTLMKSKLENNQPIDKEIKQFNDSIEDILTLTTSKHETLEEVDIAEIAAYVCDLYNEYPVEFDFDEDASTITLGQYRWLQRAITNLVENGIKYCKTKVSVYVTAENNSVILTVTDDGIGIPQDKLNQIFDFTYQINELNEDGYGIGLSIVRHVCDLCKGIFYVESTPEIGTKFYLSFKQL